MCAYLRRVRMHDDSAAYVDPDPELWYLMAINWQIKCSYSTLLSKPAALHIRNEAQNLGICDILPCICRTGHKMFSPGCFPSHPGIPAPTTHDDCMKWCGRDVSCDAPIDDIRLIIDYESFLGPDGLGPYSVRLGINLTG